MQNGRLLRMSLELLVACMACLAAALLMPLSFWQTLGEGGRWALSFGVAALVTGAIVLRHRTAMTLRRHRADSEALAAAS